MNELKHMAEFRSVLADYRPSDEAKEILKDVTLVLLLAPTAGGRNTIMYKLLEKGGYYFIISDTTRHPRMNDGVLEEDGKQYWFRTEEQVLHELQRGEFLEAEIIHGQQVSGTSIRELDKARRLHKIALDEVDIGGVANIVEAKADAIVVLVLPPSFEEWLRRVDSRGPMHPVERRRRFETAAKIYQMAHTGKYKIVINDKLEDAVSAVDKLARFGEVDQQETGYKLAADLFEQTKAYLSAQS
jgi:guanylate kinase